MADAARTLRWTPAHVQAPWLLVLGSAPRGVVQPRFRLQTVSFGAVLMEQGRQAPGLMVVLEGRVRLVCTHRGEEHHILTLGPAETLGAAAMLDAVACGFTARATEQTTVALLPRQACRSVLAEPAARAVLTELAAHQRRLHFLRTETALAEQGDPLLSAIARSACEASLTQGDDTPIWLEAGELAIVADGLLQERSPRGRRHLRRGHTVVGPATLHGSGPAIVWTIDATLTTALATADDALESLLSEGSTPDERPPLDHLLAEPQSPTEEPVPHAELPQARSYRRRRIRRIPVVRQVDETDCGAACLAMVARYFDRDVSLHALRRLLHTGTQGTSLRNLVVAAEAIGLSARSAKLSTSALDDMPLPAVLHVDGAHWVVVHDVRDRHVRLVDPATGRDRVTREDLEARWSGFALLIDQVFPVELSAEEGLGLNWLLPFLRPHTRTLALAVGLAAMVSGLEMALPIFTQVVFDTVLVHGSVSLLQMVMLGMTVVIALSTAASLVQRYLLSFVAVRIDGCTLDALTHTLLSLPQSYFDARRTGDLKRRLAGLRQVRQFAVQSGLTVLTSLTQLTAALLLLGLYSPTLLGVLAITAPVYALLMRVSARWLQPLFSSLESAFGAYDAHQIDAIEGIETIKALAAEPAMRRKMLHEFLDIADRQFRADLSVMSYQAAVRAVGSLTSVTFLGVGAWLVLQGRLTVGGLVASSALAGMATGPIGALLKVWDELQLVQVLLDRLEDVVVEPPEQAQGETLPVPALSGEIRLEGVHFAYPGTDNPDVLDGLSLHIAPGETVALVGRSGSGKSTLAKLLAGLYTPTEGRLLVDGLDITRLCLPELRRHLGFVLQDTYLFDETLAANIGLGDADPDPVRVADAARAACADAFIRTLPLAYDTKAGPRGGRLSGGQRQRIAIARALYRDPRILVLDEATSALDTASERAVQQSLDQALEGRTSIIIAHRLSTVRTADRIVVLEAGRIVEQGSHDELVARHGVYWDLCRQQLELA